MSGVYVHLLLNHVPILGTFFGLALLLLGLARRSDEVARAAWLALVVAALVALPVYFSGEPAEQAVKGRPEVSNVLIERHEEAAERAFAAVSVLGVVCLLALIAARGERRPARGFTAATLILALVAGGLMAYAASLGGQIRHAEIRAGAEQPAPRQEGGAVDQDDGH